MSVSGVRYLLASGSPRRRELLRQIGVQFDTVVSDVDEHIPPCEPRELVCALAERKAEAVFEKDGSIPVIGADTVVVLDGNVMGKPSDHADAERMLRSLSGRTHDVYTGVCVIYRDAGARRVVLRDVCRTSVTFTDMSESDIAAYASSPEPYDKAGAYGIQGLGAKYIEKIDGDYFNVVGLPLCRLAKLLACVEESLG